jgi:hypothetical protein
MLPVCPEASGATLPLATALSARQRPTRTRVAILTALLFALLLLPIFLEFASASAASQRSGGARPLEGLMVPVGEEPGR